MTWQLHQKKPPVHLRWSWHCLFLLKRWWTWLSETRSRGGGGSAAQFFFFWEMREGSLFFRFGARASRQTPPAQGPIFQVSARASANPRPRTPACGLHHGPLKCLVARALTLKIVPWAGGVGSAGDVWRCKCWSLIGEKVVNVLSFVSNLNECMHVCCWNKMFKKVGKKGSQKGAMPFFQT